jgi:hypothetical protein
VQTSSLDGLSFFLTQTYNCYQANTQRREYSMPGQWSVHFRDQHIVLQDDKIFGMCLWLPPKHYTEPECLCTSENLFLLWSIVSIILCWHRTLQQETGKIMSLAASSSNIELEHNTKVQEHPLWINRIFLSLQQPLILRQWWSTNCGQVIHVHTADCPWRPHCFHICY